MFILWFVNQNLRPPLIRWDGFHVVADLAQLEAFLQERVAGIQHLGTIRLTGVGDGVEVRAQVLWKKFAAEVLVQIAEVRLRRRFLGFRVRRIRLLGAVRIPRAVVEKVLSSLENELVTVFRGQGIVVIDMRSWIPAELNVAVVTVQATRRGLHVWLGPGELVELPGRMKALPAGGRAGLRADWKNGGGRRRTEGDANALA